MSQATDMLAAYIAAELAVLKGKTYRLGERQLGRENLAEIIAGRKEWERRVAAESAAAAGKSGTTGYALADFSGCRQ